MKTNTLELFKVIANESMGMEMETPAYPGSNIPEAWLAMESFEDMEAIAEATETFVYGQLSMWQEMALESAGLSLEQINDYQGELSTESVVNKVKRVYYGAKIQAKKFIAKIMEVIQAILEFFVGADGRISSYGKLFKKYGEKLNKTTEYDADKLKKDVSVRDFGKLKDLLSEFKNAVKSDGIKTATTALRGITKDNEVDDVMKALVTINFGWFSTKFASKGTDVITADEIEKALEDNNLDEAIKDLKDDFKFDSTDMTIEEAIQTFQGYCSTFKEEAKDNLKFKKEMKDLIKSMKKAIAALDKDKARAKDAATATDQDSSKHTHQIEDIKLLNAKVRMFVNIKKNMSAYYKLVASGLQACLADTAKVISAGTSLTTK